MAAQPKVSHITAKQRAADKANLVKARAAAAHKPRTARQKVAARQNLVKARAAQRSRRGGKTPVARKKAAAPLNLQLNLAPEAGDTTRNRFPLQVPGLHLLPVCAAVAVAASLQMQCGVIATAAEILDLYQQAGVTAIGTVLEAAAGYGLAGRRLARFTPLDPELCLDGLVCGIQLPYGYHAVCTAEDGMLSWGMLLPLAGIPEEAWLLEWGNPDD
jgi:hypothetical protein